MSNLIIGIIITLILVVIIFIITILNKITKKKNKVKEAFSTMDIFLKKRYDLITNLVKITSSYSKYENETLKEIVSLRNYDSLNINEKIKANEEINKNITKLLALVENYPELKADKSYLNLSDNLVKVEDEIAHSRKYYNASVREFNNLIEIFPNNIISKLIGSSKIEMYSIKNEEKENIKVGDLNEKNN